MRPVGRGPAPLGPGQAFPGEISGFRRLIGEGGAELGNFGLPGVSGKGQRPG